MIVSEQIITLYQSRGSLVDSFPCTPSNIESAVIEQAKDDDLRALLNLLEATGLPEAGLADHLDTTLVVRKDSSLIGSAGLEMYGQFALLRSVAVEEEFRACGLGQCLVESALQLAQYRGVAQVFLLTETAEAFFPRFGFRKINRWQVPTPVQSSVEFTSACPDSATAMALTIRSDRSPRTISSA